jgi:hypothetical protein
MDLVEHQAVGATKTQMIGDWMGIGETNALIVLRIAKDLGATATIARETEHGIETETYDVGMLEATRGEFRLVDDGGRVTASGVAFRTGARGYAQRVAFVGIPSLAAELALFLGEEESWVAWMARIADGPRAERPFLRNALDVPVRVCFFAGRAEELCVGPGAPGRALFRAGQQLGDIVVYDLTGAVVGRTNETELRKLGCVNPDAPPEYLCEVSRAGFRAIPFADQR